MLKTHTNNSYVFEFSSTYSKDMGLGKTLTIICLILTNHHDEKPLAKRSYGYIRPPIVYGKRTGGTRRKAGYEI